MNGVPGDEGFVEGLKLLLVFALMALLLIHRAPLGPVVLGGSAILAALYYTHPLALLSMLWRATKSWTTIELEMILVFIMLLERLLAREGYQKRMLESLCGLVQDRRAVMALLPAFIGLMPSAGGARFSAPLVGQATANTPMAAEVKSFINYYYRHIWEYFLPLYPGVLLASRLSGLPLPGLIAALAPYGLLVILLGLPVLRQVPPVNEEVEVARNYRGVGRELFLSTWPVLSVVSLALVGKMEVGLALGLILAVLLALHRYTPAKFWHLCQQAIAVRTLLLVWGIMIFKQVLTDTPAVDSLPPLLAKLPIPEFLVLGLISILVGMLTGLMVAFVGITFPLVAGVTGGQLSLPLAVFVFVAGFAGHMLSPFHLCLVLTVDFFKADLRKVLRMVIVPELTLLMIALGVYLFW